MLHILQFSCFSWNYQELKSPHCPLCPVPGYLPDHHDGECDFSAAHLLGLQAPLTYVLSAPWSLSYRHGAVLEIILPQLLAHLVTHDPAIPVPTAWPSYSSSMCLAITDTLVIFCHGSGSIHGHLSPPATLQWIANAAQLTGLVLGGVCGAQHAAFGSPLPLLGCRCRRQRSPSPLLFVTTDHFCEPLAPDIHSNWVALLGGRLPHDVLIASFVLSYVRIGATISFALSSWCAAVQSHLRVHLLWLAFYGTVIWVYFQASFPEL